MIAASGVDSKEHFDRVVKVQTGVTMREQADAWYSLMSNPRRVGKNGRRTALSTLDSWKGIVESIKTELGGIPLSALVQNQQPVADFVTKLVNGGEGPKTVKNYFFVVKAIVASAKDVSTRKPLYPVAWDNEVLLMPRVNPKKQHRPTFTAAQVSQIVERVKGVYKMLFIVLAATGLRIGEAIGLKVENVLDGCYRLRISRRTMPGGRKTFSRRTTASGSSSCIPASQSCCASTSVPAPGLCLRERGEECSVCLQHLEALSSPRARGR